MKYTSRTLEQKLVIGVAIGLSVFTVIASIATAAFSFRHETTINRTWQTQLIDVIRTQAEVAVFAENEEIARGVIDGLLSTPVILAVRISSPQGFSISGGKKSALADQEAITSYSLYSPTDNASKIGQIDVVLDQNRITEKVMIASLLLFSVIALQVILAALLIVMVSRRVIILPIVELAARINAIEPGSGLRVVTPENHIDDEIGQLSRITNRLIESHEKILAELHELATIDELTGVSNRRHFIRLTGNELARIQRLESTPASVLMLDLDHFKKINDDFGHPTGDAALSQLGTILRSVARRIDVVGRLGGEEFAILLVGTKLDEAVTFADRLRITVEETPVVHGLHELHMTLSIGVCTLLETDKDPEAALARADKALYQAKAQGRNRVVMTTN